jgi:hypothetical protein
VKDAHLLDAAFQYYVLEKCGVVLTTMHVMYLNKSYQRPEAGPVDISALFVTQDVTKSIIENQIRIQEQVDIQLQIIDIEDCVPAVKIGAHCHSPYACAFTDHCWNEAKLLQPENNILQLTRGGKKKWDLFHRGIKSIADIPESSYKLLSKDQQIQWQCEKTKIPHIKHDELLLFTQCLEYPLYFLDFETIMPSIPLFPSTRCYQPICFQYSIHRRQTPGDIGVGDSSDKEHFEHLANGSELDGVKDGSNSALLFEPLPDIRLEFIEKLLLDIGSCGSIIVYSSYERARLQELIRDFPQYGTKIEAIIERIVDLAEPFRKKHYYHHDMQGSYSIKNVFPALVPEMRQSYKDLDIGKGDVASSTFLGMLTGTFNGDVADCRRSLLAYCQLDTWAMVMVMSKIMDCCNSVFGNDVVTPSTVNGASDIASSITNSCSQKEIISSVDLGCDDSMRQEDLSLPPLERRSSCDSVSEASQQRLSNYADFLSQPSDVVDIDNNDQRYIPLLDDDVVVHDVMTHHGREIFVLQKSLYFDEKYAGILIHNEEADITVVDDRVQLNFRFNKNVIEAIKVYISSRTYNHVTKSWSCPFSSLGTAMKLYQFMGKKVTIDQQYLTPEIMDRHDRVITVDIHFPDTRSVIENLLRLRSDDMEEVVSPPLGSDSAVALVTFDFDAEVVAALKELDPYYRSYNPQKKEWKVSCFLLSELLEKFNRLNYKSVSSSFP